MTLADLLPGESGIIQMVKCDRLVRERLADLGLLPGTPIRVQFRGPSGEPTAYWVRGSLLALRRSTAENIIMHPLGRVLA